jgi:hypothetical protein
MGSMGGSPSGYYNDPGTYRQPIGGAPPNPMGGGATDPFAGFSPQDTSNFANMGANYGTRALGAAGPEQADRFYRDMRGMQALGAAMPDQATRDAFMRLGGRAPLPARPTMPAPGTVGASTIDPSILASIQSILSGLQQQGPTAPAQPIPTMDVGRALMPAPTYTSPL